MDSSLRVGAGLGLLLLVAAQQKLCPWLTSPTQAVSRDNSAANTKGGEPRKRANHPLPYALPDAPAPRWPTIWNQVAFRLTTGWHDGVVSCGPHARSGGDRAGPSAALADPWWWHRFLRPIGFGKAVRPNALVFTHAHHAIHTAIIPTGPPLV